MDCKVCNESICMNYTQFPFMLFKKQYLVKETVCNKISDLSNNNDHIDEVLSTVINFDKYLLAFYCKFTQVIDLQQ